MFVPLPPRPGINNPTAPIRIPVGWPYDGALADDTIAAYSDGLQLPANDRIRHDDTLFVVKKKKKTDRSKTCVRREGKALQFCGSSGDHCRGAFFPRACVGSNVGNMIPQGNVGRQNNLLLYSPTSMLVCGCLRRGQRIQDTNDQICAFRVR